MSLLLKVLIEPNNIIFESRNGHKTPSNETKCSALV